MKIFNPKADFAKIAISKLLRKEGIRTKDLKKW
ncbi:MAG: hypothetical protein UY49_C0025G0001, partial [Microgenomates group bacterium GW2011_GWC1_49_7]